MKAATLAALLLAGSGCEPDRPVHVQKPPEEKVNPSQGSVRAHLFISGRVQGVGFRASTEQEAQRLGGIVGWVKNLPDGRVEAVLQGPKDKVDALVKWCHQGPPTAIVEKVEVTWETTLEDFNDFRTRF